MIWKRGQIRFSGNVSFAFLGLPSGRNEEPAVAVNVVGMLTSGSGPVIVGVRPSIDGNGLGLGTILTACWAKQRASTPLIRPSPVTSPMITGSSNAQGRKPVPILTARWASRRASVPS